jgi:hypothetical protein
MFTTPAGARSPPQPTQVCGSSASTAPEWAASSIDLGNLIVAGEDAAGRYPGVAAHLAACGPCAEDFTGLLAAVASD